MTELQRSSDSVAKPADALTYLVLVAKLAAAGTRLAGVGERVRSTYRYVERCAAGVDRLADQMAALDVDTDTVAEHAEAAAVMRAALEAAEAMASSIEDLSVLFTHTSEAHQADYGQVHEAAQGLPVPMANAAFYANR